MPDLKEIFSEALKNQSSDLHLSQGLPPVCRSGGYLKTLPFPALTQQDMQSFLEQLLTPAQRKELDRRGELDASASHIGEQRVRTRLNAYRQRGSWCIAFRIINKNISSFEELGLPRSTMEELCRLNNGLVLVTGATGSGKTTTIGAMIDWINHNRACHIITIEDPIEYHYPHDLSIIHQRETGRDTKSFRSALKAALRQDPDIIFIGEMRDLDSISTALTAAETGHLVLSTLHTVGAGKTIDRIIDVFPAARQQQIRTQLSLVLRGVVSQQLIPCKNQRDRVLASEILLSTPAASNLIREGRTAQLMNVIVTGTQSGMRTMDASLIELVQSGAVSIDDARAYSGAPAQFDALAARAIARKKGGEAL